MRLKDYFIGQKVVLRAMLPRDEVQRRINRESGSIFWPFGFDRVVGGARLGFVRLGYQSSPIDYNAKPILAGRLYEHLGSTEFRMRFGAAAWVKVFFAFWYLVLLSMVVVFASNPSGIEPGAGPVILIVFPFFLVMPLLMHFAFTRNSDEDLNRILEFLEREALATPAP